MPEAMLKGARMMVSRRVAVASVLVALCGILLVGCGGETTIDPSMIGIYSGLSSGDGIGPIRLYCAPNAQISGNLLLEPLCPDPMQMTGQAGPNGRVTFTVTGCGCTYTFKGKIKRLAPGSNTYVGSGTWSGCGKKGTWTVTWIARTGSIGL
jgi:hypothetical protein